MPFALHSWLGWRCTCPSSSAASFQEHLKWPPVVSRLASLPASMSGAAALSWPGRASSSGLAGSRSSVASLPASAHGTGSTDSAACAEQTEMRAEVMRTKKSKKQVLSACEALLALRGLHGRPSMAMKSGQPSSPKAVAASESG